MGRVGSESETSLPGGFEVGLKRDEMMAKETPSVGFTTDIARQLTKCRLLTVRS
jgi:hypothetical protein